MPGGSGYWADPGRTRNSRLSGKGPFRRAGGEVHRFVVPLDDLHPLDTERALSEGPPPKPGSEQVLRLPRTHHQWLRSAWFVTDGW